MSEHRHTLVLIALARLQRRHTWVSVIVVDVRVYQESVQLSGA
jgi:hypothetical protein